MNKEEVLEKIKSINFPILFSEGRQLELIKDGKLIGSYDPVYSIEIIKNDLVIKGWLDRQYLHSINEFDNIVVEKFELDEDGDRIYVEPYYKF